MSEDHQHATKASFLHKLVEKGMACRKHVIGRHELECTSSWNDNTIGSCVAVGRMHLSSHHSLCEVLKSEVSALVKRSEECKQTHAPTTCLISILGSQSQ